MRRWLIRLVGELRPTMAANAERCGADRYREHFDHFAHLVFLLYHGLSGHPSLRTSYATLPTAPGFVDLAGLATADPEPLGISFSQLAASQHSRPAAVLSGLLPELIARVRAAGVPPAVDLPAGLYLLDSTFVHLALGTAPWLPAKGGADPAGVRVQTLYVPAFDLVEQVVVTDTRANDCQGFDQLLLDDPAQMRRLAGATLVVDLGYYSHARFAQLRDAGVHAVSRLHPQGQRPHRGRAAGASAVAHAARGPHRHPDRFPHYAGQRQDPARRGVAGHAPGHRNGGSHRARPASRPAARGLSAGDRSLGPVQP